MTRSLVNGNKIFINSGSTDKPKKKTTTQSLQLEMLEMKQCIAENAQTIGSLKGLGEKVDHLLQALLPNDPEVEMKVDDDDDEMQDGATSVYDNFLSKAMDNHTGNEYTSIK